MNKTNRIIALGLSCLSVLALVACSGANKKEETTSKNDKVETSSSKKETEKKGKLAIGDKITFDKVAEYTITNVEWTDERNQFDKTNPDKVLKVTYNVTNLSEKDLAVGWDMNLYVGSKKMDSYANTNTAETLSSGRSLEGAVQHFGVIGNGDFELEIKPIADFKSKPAIVAFKLD